MARGTRRASDRIGSAGTGPARALRRPRGRVGVVAALVVAGLLLTLVPATPASAAPAPTTTTVTVESGSGPLATVSAIVRDSTTNTRVPTGGVIVVSEGGTELVRATIVNSTATSVTIANVPGPRTLVVDFLGTADHGPSSGQVTFTKTFVAPAVPVTGTVSFGSATAPVSPRSDYEIFHQPWTGIFHVSAFQRDQDALDVTVDVPGTGPVTASVVPYWDQANFLIRPSGAVALELMYPRIAVTTIRVGGIAWAANCTLALPPIAASGTRDAAGVSLTATSPAPTPVAPDDCGGRGALVNAAVGGPVAIDLRIPGSFPLPVPAGTTSAVTVTANRTAIEPGEWVTLTADLTWAGTTYSPCCTVEFLDGTTSLGTSTSATYLPGGVVRWTMAAFPTGSGTHTITARFAGRTSSIGEVLVLPSSDTVDIAVAPPPPGRPTTGQVLVGSQAPTLFDAETRFTGGDYDPATGAIGPATFVIPRGGFQVVLGVPVRYHLRQIGTVTGQVEPDGSVTLDPAAFELEAFAFNFGSWGTLTNCTFALTVPLSGTADADGLHLTAPGVPVPPVPSSGCSGWGSGVNSALRGGMSFTFDVAGDFTREEPPLALTSWFPSIAQHNQTYLVASVGDGSTTGLVTFRDGTTELGTAPVDGSGHATLTVALHEPGTRSIVAQLDTGATATTTVDVTAGPEGLAMGGTVTIGGVELPVAAGSQLVPQTADGAPLDRSRVAAALAESTASLWFMPTTVALDLPSIGPVTAEVRLTQWGSMTRAALDGPNFNGLNGYFVLQVRSVTTPAGTVIPTGCVNLVGLGFGGQLSTTDVVMGTTAAGAGRIPVASCTGVGRTVAEHLAGGTTAATIHVTL